MARKRDAGPSRGAYAVTAVPLEIRASLGFLSDERRKLEVQTARYREARSKLLDRQLAVALGRWLSTRDDKRLAVEIERTRRARTT